MPFPFGPVSVRAVPLGLAQYALSDLALPNTSCAACLHERLERVTLKVPGAARPRSVIAEVVHLAEHVDVAAAGSYSEQALLRLLAKRRMRLDMSEVGCTCLCAQRGSLCAACLVTSSRAAAPIGASTNSATSAHRRGRYLKTNRAQG